MVMFPGNFTKEGLFNMKTVYRYSIRDGSSIKMPSGAKILKIENGSVWAYVDTDKPEVMRNLLPVETGEEIPGTVVFNPPSAGHVGSDTTRRPVIHYFDGGESVIDADKVPQKFSDDDRSLI